MSHGLTRSVSHLLLSAWHADAILTGTLTRGDTLYVNATPQWTNLPIGTNGQVLQSDGTDIAWATLATGTNALLDASSHTDTTASAVLQGSVIVGDGTPEWTALAIGTATWVLTSDGTDAAWAVLPTQTSTLLDGTVHTDTTAGTVVRGDVIVGDTNPAWSRLAIGTATYVLTSDGTDAAWAVATGVTDHGALSGLTDDDHSIYPLLLGRSTGQDLSGGTAASENLTLRGTTNATEGSVIIDDSSFIVKQELANPSTSTGSFGPSMAGEFWWEWNGSSDGTMTTATGGVDGQIIIITNLHATSTLTLTHGLSANNFRLPGAVDFVLASLESAMFRHGPQVWYLIGTGRI